MKRRRPFWERWPARPRFARSAANASAARQSTTAVPGKAAAKSSAKSFTLGRWLMPVLPCGTFDVYVSVGKVDGTPVYELPYPGDDGHRRYRLGAIEFASAAR